MPENQLRLGNRSEGRALAQAIAGVSSPDMIRWLTCLQSSGHLPIILAAIRNAYGTDVTPEQALGILQPMYPAPVTETTTLCSGDFLGRTPASLRRLQRTLGFVEDKPPSELGLYGSFGTLSHKALSSLYRGDLHFPSSVDLTCVSQGREQMLQGVLNNQDENVTAGFETAITGMLTSIWTPLG